MKKPLTEEEVKIAARIKAIIADKSRNLTEDLVAAKLGVTQGNVSHWTNARSPVPSSRAIKLASVLGIEDPGEISVAYRKMAEEAAYKKSAGTIREDLFQARILNDVESMRAVIGVLVAAMIAHRPAEARDVHEGLTTWLPDKYRREGFGYELLQALEAGVGAGAAKVASRRQPKPPGVA